MPALRAAGHQVVRLVRDPKQAGAGAVVWNPAKGQLDAAALAGCDAAVNLAGENIAGGRWTDARKHAIHDSRVQATGTLAQALARVAPRPRVLVNASAVGFYGSRGDERLDEASARGSGDFLSAVCRDWEAAARPAADAGIRLVLARFGVILSGSGGALKKMLLPFKLGLGGKIGSGRQWMSWIAIDDVIAGILHGLQNDAVSGPVNFVAPDAVTNAEYTKTLGRVLSRPTLFPMPAFAARLAFGQMGEELLLGSQRVEPKRLVSSGYAFQYPELEAALRHVLEKSK